jgi:hypothetical protein
MSVLKISARELDPAVSYNRPLQTFAIGSQKEEKVLFLASTLQEEVIKGTTEQQKKNIRKLKKLLRGFAAVAVVGMKTSPKAFAATTPALGTGAAITPAVVMQWGLTLALISVSVGVALAMIMLSVAGIYRMFRKRDIATEWSTDVIKGLVQVLIAVPTVYLLFYLAQLVFKNLPVLNGLF